jgi:hypothetical protein
MNNYKKIFSKHGYSLFEPDSLEDAIIEAIKDNKIRYIYGIPILFETSEIDIDLLIRLAKEKKLTKELKEILAITAKLIKKKTLARTLEKHIRGIKIRHFDLSEFKRNYEDYQLTKGHAGFPPSLNYHLSFLFAKKQIKILFKVKNHERLTKTEKEYFSRVIKKKLAAIREAYPLAKELLG